MAHNYLIMDSSNNYVNIILADNIDSAKQPFPSNYIIIEDTDARHEVYIRDLIDNNYYKNSPS